MKEKEYELLKNAYKQGEIFISVDLTKSRQIMMQIRHKPVLVFYYIMLVLLLTSCVLSFFIFGWFGILYSITYLMVWTSFLGSCSLPQSSKYGNNIIIIGIFFTIISFLFSNFYITFLVILSFIELYLAYYFYRFSAKELLSKFILKDVKYFNEWINNVFFIKINSNNFKDNMYEKDKEENENLEKFIELLEKKN